MSAILIVDDDDDVRRLIQISLERVGGHEVRAVASGRECIEVLSEWTPDAVILDVMMPVLDGPATLALIREDPATARLPVVFLTASVVESDVSRLLELPVAGVLSKPFDPLQLPAQLAEQMGW